MNPVIVLSKDLRSRLGAARDQGPRPTCLAFAASDLHGSVRPGWDPLSCESAFFNAQRRSGRPPTVGATLPSMIDALREDGQPVEAAWPYLIQTPQTIAAWQSPATESEVFRRCGSAVVADPIKPRRAAQRRPPRPPVAHTLAQLLWTHRRCGAGCQR